ncbi:polysaccharide lyase [Vibrio ishigakensis]|uniref:polysaccharide lyase n=1 Tax=Vibrio ishigakensis TaxID=1481914 RepID=UPI0021C2EB7A|nr:polysaccharide lyase [Vibrio ishigakensis]
MNLKALLIATLFLSSAASSEELLQCPELKNKTAPTSRYSSFDSLAGWGKHFGYEHSAQIVDDPTGKANQVLRVELRDGDVYRTRSGEHYRAEVYETFRAKFDTPMQYSFKVLITDEWQTADVRALIAQWHGTPDRHLGEISRSPNLGIELRNDRFLIRGQTSSEPINQHNKIGMHRETFFLSEPIKRNHWYHFDIDVTWSHTNRGSLKLKLDGDTVIGHQGPTSYYDCVGPYFKMGIYRDKTPMPFVIYFDDFSRQNNAD